MDDKDCQSQVNQYNLICTLLPTHSKHSSRNNCSPIHKDRNISTPNDGIYIAKHRRPLSFKYDGKTCHSSPLIRRDICSSKSSKRQRRMIDMTTENNVVNDYKGLFLTGTLQREHNETTETDPLSSKENNPNMCSLINVSGLVYNYNAPNTRYKFAPSSIDPLFFIVHGDQPLNRTKCLNFVMNPSMKKGRLFAIKMQSKVKTSERKELYQKEVEREDKIFYKTLEVLRRHESLKRENYISYSQSFNKFGVRHVNSLRDVKEMIYNHPIDCYEDKNSAIKKILREEISTRACGRGTSIENLRTKYLEKLKESQRKNLSYMLNKIQLIDKQDDIEIEKYGSTLKINMQKDNVFHKGKAPFQSSEVHYNRNLFNKKHLLGDYKTCQGTSLNENENENLNLKVNLNKKRSIKKENQIPLLTESTKFSTHGNRKISIKKRSLSKDQWRDRKIFLELKRIKDTELTKIIEHSNKI